MLPKNLISRYPEQSTLDGRSSGGLLPETSVLAEALVGDAAQQLELKRRWRMERGNGHTRDETLVCRQGPLYRHAPVGFHPWGDEPGQSGWELAVEQLARVSPYGRWTVAARVSSRLGRVAKPHLAPPPRPRPGPARPGASRRARGGSARRRARGRLGSAARACGFPVLLLNLSIGASQGSLFKLIALLVISPFGTNHFCT